MIRGIFKKILIALSIIILLWILVGSYFVFLGSYSDGYRIGTVIKLSKKGYIFKTYEGQLNLEFFPAAGKTNNQQSNIWDFSVADKEVASSIELANDHGKRVKLYYDEKYYRLPWVGETKYVVNKVEELPSN
jgi:hypothetical protein